MEELADIYRRQKLTGKLLLVIREEELDITFSNEIISFMMERGIKTFKRDSIQLHGYISQDKEGRLFHNGEEVSMAYFFAGFIPQIYNANG
jgi:hypothetical protein